MTLVTIIVKKWYSPKKEKEYIALMMDNGKREWVLTFDRYSIAEYLGCKIYELRDLDCGYHESTMLSRRKE